MISQRRVLKILIIITLCQSGHAFSQTLDSLNISSLIFSKQFKIDTVPQKFTDIIVESLLELKVAKGTILFSGTNFPDIKSIEINSVGFSMKTSPLGDLINRCVAGSRITFTNVSIMLKGGTYSGPINKSIFIQ